MNEAEIWAGVERLVDRAPRLSDLRAHRLHLFALRRWRQEGRPIPADLAADELRAAIATITVPVLLERVRGVLDGPVLLLKGREVAARYPDPDLRPSVDVDVLVSDARKAQRALIGAGFREVGDPDLYTDIHHLRPLLSPGLPVWVEVHSRPKWVSGLEGPSIAALLASAVPASISVDGLSTLPPAEHAVALAVHSWAHEQPLSRIWQIVDVAAMAQGVPEAELIAVARHWHVERLWRTTMRAAETLLVDEPPPLALTLWARNLQHVRERTVFENHAQRCLSDLWVLPPRRALSGLPATIAREFRPSEGESWAVKLTRTRRAMRNAALRKTEHDRSLDSPTSTSGSQSNR
jgi:Uncharacterised nucleotidyltransferase